MLRYYDDIPLEKVTTIGEYVGNDPALFGECALLFIRADGKVLAHFDNPMLVYDGDFVGDAWHEFERSDFMTDDDIVVETDWSLAVGLGLLFLVGIGFAILGWI